VNAIGFDGVSTGFAPNYPLTNTSVTGVIGNAQEGWYSDAGPFPDGVIFRNDVLRTDEQLGVFGEVTFDLNEQFSLVLGARWYDIEVDFEGSANSSFYNLGQTEDAQAFGTNISAQFAPDNTVGAPDKAATDGTIFKVTLDWRPNDDHTVLRDGVGRIPCRHPESPRWCFRTEQLHGAVRTRYRRCHQC